MKLCVYKDSLSVGRGADKAVRGFAEALSGRGHDVGLVERPALSSALGERWDVIVATGSNEALDLDRAGYFEREGRSPVVLQLHLAPCGFFKWRHPLRNMAIRRAFRKADFAQVLCRDYIRALRRIAPGLKARVIGNFTEIGRQARDPDPQSRTILYPAAVVNKVKNQKLLIEAFARVAADFPGWKVRLLGRCDLRYADACRALARRLGVGDRVEFAGFTDDLVGEYSRAAFVAFPSMLEGFPLAILEAAAFSLPAVVHRLLPGAGDIVVDGETGIVSDCTPASYAGALSRMMEDGVPVRRSFGRCAKRTCGNLFSKETVMSGWEELLGEAAKGGGGHEHSGH